MQFLATTKRSKKKKKDINYRLQPIVKTEEDGVNLKNVGSTFGLVSGDNPA